MLADAQLEHASVAAFSSFSLSLLALGAPSRLLRSCAMATLDEIRHAELCFALASEYLGRALAPAPLDTTGAKVCTDEVQLAKKSTPAQRTRILESLQHRYSQLLGQQHTRLAQAPCLADEEQRHWATQGRLSPRKKESLSLLNLTEVVGPALKSLRDLQGIRSSEFPPNRIN